MEKKGEVLNGLDKIILRLRPALRDSVRLHHMVKILQLNFKCNVHMRDNVIIESMSQKISTSVQHLLKEIAKSQNCASMGHNLSINFILWHKDFSLGGSYWTNACLFILSIKTLCQLLVKQEFV